jgi:hypothetical protein
MTNDARNVRVARRCAPLVAAGLATFLGVPVALSARVVNVRCLDGLLPTIGSHAHRYCDVDGTTDGVCTVALLRCGELNCGTEFITVPRRHRRTVRVPGFMGAATTYVLHCRAPVSCDPAHRCTAVTRTCQDTVLGPMQEGQCDLDQEDNGRCSFGFFCAPVCGALVDDVDVPVGGSRIVQSARQPGRGVTRYTLRCLASP